MLHSGKSLLGAPPAPVYWLYRLWCRSLRYTEINRAAIGNTTDQDRPVVLPLQHDELFPLICLKRRLNIIALVSRSDDGDLLAGVLERMGLKTARGSSSRGGVKALLAVARRMRESGIYGCVTVDSPRDPRHEVKEGAIFLATRADAPIVPIRLFMKRHEVLKSWGRFQLPLPFSRVSMVCTDAYRVECDIRDPEAVARECRRLEEKLEILKAPELPSPPSLLHQFSQAFSRAMCRVGYGFALLLGKLGFSRVRSLTRGLGSLLWTCLLKRRRLATESTARHLEFSQATAESLARASFTHNVRSFLELVLVPESGLSHPLLDVERPGLLERLKRGERPSMITMAYLGAWELLASLLEDVSDHLRLTVVRMYKNKLMDCVTTRLCSSHGADVIGHQEAASPVLRTLRKNGYAAFLVDHNTSRSEVFFLPFLGEEVAVNKGPAVLAVRAKALVWPIASIRDGDRYRIIIEEPLDTALLEGDAEEKALAVAAFYMEANERMVRRAPDQWPWMHNRWKTKRAMDD